MATTSSIEQFAEKKWGLKQVEEILKPYGYSEATVKLVHLYVMGCLLEGKIEKSIPNFSMGNTYQEGERVLQVHQVVLQQLAEAFVENNKMSIIDIARIQYLTVDQQVELLNHKLKNNPPS